MNWQIIKGTVAVVVAAEVELFTGNKPIFYKQLKTINYVTIKI